MEQPAAYELVWMECHDGTFPGAAGCPVEADVTMFVVVDDSLGADGAALDVAGEVADGGFA